MITRPDFADECGNMSDAGGLTPSDMNHLPETPIARIECNGCSEKDSFSYHGRRTFGFEVAVSYWLGTHKRKNPNCEGTWVTRLFD